MYLLYAYAYEAPFGWGMWAYRRRFITRYTEYTAAANSAAVRRATTAATDTAKISIIYCQFSVNNKTILRGRQNACSAPSEFRPQTTLGTKPMQTSAVAAHDRLWIISDGTNVPHYMYYCLIQTCKISIKGNKKSSAGTQCFFFKVSFVV